MSDKKKIMQFTSKNRTFCAKHYEMQITVLLFNFSYITAKTIDDCIVNIELINVSLVQFHFYFHCEKETERENRCINSDTIKVNAAFIQMDGVIVSFISQAMQTRMHSSRMHTVHALTIRWGGGGGGGVYLPGEGVYLPGGCTCLGGVPAQGVYLSVGGTCWGVPARGCTCLGVYLPRGCTCPGGVPAQGGCTCPGAPPSCEQNDRQVQKYYIAPNFVCGR